MFCKSPKLFRSMCKNYQETNVFSEKSSKPSSGLSECSYDNAWWRFFSPKTKNSLVKTRERLENQNFPPKKLSICFPGYVDSGFENPAVNCLMRAIKISHQMTKIVPSRHKNFKKIITFRNVSPQKRPWTRRMKFWKTHRIFFAKSLRIFFAQRTKKFPSGHENYEKPFFFH